MKQASTNTVARPVVYVPRQGQPCLGTSRARSLLRDARGAAADSGEKIREVDIGRLIATVNLQRHDGREKDFRTYLSSFNRNRAAVSYEAPIASSEKESSMIIEIEVEVAGDELCD